MWRQQHRPYQQNRINRLADVELIPDIKFPVKSDNNIRLIPRFNAVDLEPLSNEATFGKSDKIKVYIGSDDKKKFHRDNVGGKSRWFVYADDSKEKPHGVICSVKEIDTNAQKLFLQALLIQMDNKLHQHKENCLRKRKQEDGMPRKLEESERALNINLLVYGCSDKSTGIKPDQDALIDRSSGRTVFYLTVGQMKYWRISIKQLSANEQVKIIL
jgi:hypothetical protein